MSELKIYFSIEHCGDGSAFPWFFDSMKLADWHQEHQDEEWGEECTGSITVHGDGKLACPNMQSTIEFYLSEILEDESERGHAQDFIDTFFDGIPPQFELRMNNRAYSRPSSTKGYGCYDVMYEGVNVGEASSYPDEQPSEENMAKVQAKYNAGPQVQD